jgi:NADPH:quinone reductase-like Zn-dependent oxidoreductase
MTGSATSANITIQLAKLAGLKVAVMVDKAKHGYRLTNHRAIRADLLVDSHDPARAVDIVKANTGGQLRFGLDTRGKDTASHLLRALSAGNTPLKALKEPRLPPSPPGTPDDTMTARAHLVGMSGLPKGPAPEGSVFHAVPIKLFHDVEPIGSSLSAWLERLLQSGLLIPPDIIDVENGLESVNAGLHRMRRGEISGGKLVIRV